MNLIFEGTSGWLDSAYQHPMPVEAQASVRRYMIDKSAVNPLYPAQAVQEEVKESFARLVGAAPREIAYVSSATAGETLILAGLGLLEKGRIVTDDLHFSGSLFMYQQLRSRGVDVHVVASRGGAVDLADVDRALKMRPTNLVAISWISALNGHRHDLPAVAALAHRHGAFVYADIIQGVGALPIDLPATGVDFAATSSYKWLMGEIGAGFLWAAERTWPSVLPAAFGLRQLRARSLENGQPTAAGGIFETSTVSNIVLSALRVSLPYLEARKKNGTEGVRGPLLAHLREELRALGLIPMSNETRTTLIALQLEDLGALSQNLRSRGIYVTCTEGRVRIAPSIFNTHDNIEQLCAVLRSHISITRNFAISNGRGGIKRST